MADAQPSAGSRCLLSGCVRVDNAGIRLFFGQSRIGRIFPTAKIAKVESRSKACFDYAETKLSSAQPTIAKVESRSKACFDYAETKLSSAIANDSESRAQSKRRSPPFALPRRILSSAIANLRPNPSLANCIVFPTFAKSWARSFLYIATAWIFWIRIAFWNTRRS